MDSNEKEQAKRAQAPEVYGVKVQEDEQNAADIAAGVAAAESVSASVQQAASEFYMPKNYDRSVFDDPAARNRARDAAFEGRATIKDPYTGKNLVKSHKDAQAKYKNWAEHAGEADHTKPLKDFYDEIKDKPFLSAEEARAIANQEENLQVISKTVNASKGEKTNTELAKDSDLLTEQGKQAALQKQKEAERTIRGDVAKTQMKNAAKTFHESGVSAAKNAAAVSGAMVGIQNIVEVLQGKKDVDEALADTAVTTAKSAATWYATGGGLTVVSDVLSKSSSKFIQKLASSNVPGKVVTAVMVTGSTLKKYVEGDINTEELLLELGESGVNLVAVGPSMAIGQAAIPIPVIGAAIGALVGTALSSELYNYCKEYLLKEKREHEERLRIIKECEAAAEMTRKYREELERYIQEYFADCRSCFESAIGALRLAFLEGDADGVTAAANQITTKLGGKVEFNNKEEFRKKFFDSTYVFEF